MREHSEEIGGHDAASCPPISEGKPVIQGDTMEEVWALKDVSFAYFFLLTFLGHHRPQRGREKHAIEDFEPHYRAFSRAGDHQWPRRQPAEGDCRSCPVSDFKKISYYSLDKRIVAL
jgi:hypothetical protein